MCKPNPPPKAHCEKWQTISLLYAEYAQKIVRIRAVKVPSSGQIKFCEMDEVFGGCKIAKTTQHLQLP